MEIAGLISSIVSTIVAIVSLIFTFMTKKKCKKLEDDLNCFVENKSNIKIKSNCMQKKKQHNVNIVNGNNNFTAGGDINGH